MKSYYLLPTLALFGCAQAQPPANDPTPLPDIDTPGAYAAQRAPHLKAYPVGRYPDPNNPFVLHEGHTIYREEATPSWNLAPNASITFGPDVADPYHVTTTAELEQRVREQNDLMRVTTEQNDRLIAEIKWLQAHQVVVPAPPNPPVTHAVLPASGPEEPPKSKTNPSTEPTPKLTFWSWLWSFLPTSTKK